MTDKLVIYHGGCRDGFASAFVFWTNRLFKDARFFEGYYGQLPPYYLMHKDMEIILVDFSYKKDIIFGLLEHCKSITILDHHKTAEAELKDLKHDRIKITFDMNKSGASLAWEYCYPIKAVPWWVKYVEDRDLWKNALANTKEINAWISTWTFDFQTWSDRTFWSSTVPEDFIIRECRHKGAACLEKGLQYCREVSKNAILVDIFKLSIEYFEQHDEHNSVKELIVSDVMIVNAPQCDISELLDFILEEKKQIVAMGWWQNQSGEFQYSLRSRGDYDVSEIAKLFGGGGHKNAAGFQSKYILHVMKGKI